jgi:hypothetical protein
MAYLLYLYILGVAAAQRQFIPAQRQLHRVSHRRDLAHHHRGSRREPHIQQTVAQHTLPAHRDDLRLFPDVQFVQRHVPLPLAAALFIQSLLKSLLKLT